MADAWFSRPVIFVEDVERAVAFYVDKLGFVAGSSYSHEGRLLVADVSRSDCALLLNSQQPDKVGKGRMFISLDPEPFKALQAELSGRGAPVTAGWWGYDLMVVLDPDGNELFFPYPDGMSPDG